MPLSHEAYEKVIEFWFGLFSPFLSKILGKMDKHHGNKASLLKNVVF